jgi:hypothetical protein
MHKDHSPIFRGLNEGDYFDGHLPIVIRSLTFDQLSALHSLFTAWYSYVSYQAEISGVERSEAKRQKEYIWSALRDIHKKHPDTGAKTNDQQRSDLARIDARFVEADQIFGEADAKYNLLQTIVKIAEQDLKTISREITIKQVKEEQASRRSGGSSRFSGDRPIRSRLPTGAG